MTDLLHLAWTFLWLSFIAVGGGLGVLPEMQRQVVERYGWVTAREFVDGYTLSQLTPGPNMLVATAQLVAGSIRGRVATAVAVATFLLVGPLGVNTAIAVCLVLPVSLWCNRPRNG